MNERTKEEQEEGDIIEKEMIRYDSSIHDRPIDR